jgi:tape measure domain-containing protein
MATAAEIVVKVIDSTSQGVRSANQNLNKLEKQSGTTAVGIKNLNARLVGIGASLASGGAVLLGLGNYLDVLQNLENRLKVTGVGQEELNDVFNRLSEVANEARAPLGETIELYSRLALASESVGLSQKEVITVTENFSKILAIGGATTAEAQGAMIQFSQALASGKVQMQELNPLLDSAPIFIQQLEKQLGLTRAELREFVSKGLITSEIAARALIQATEDLDAQFGQTQQTIGQASTKLSNSFLLMIKEFDDVIGASDLCASAINLAAENVEAFSVASGTIAAGAIAALAVAFGVISLPLAAIITAVAAAAAAFVAWGDDIVVFMSDALEPVIEGFNNLKSTVKDMANNVVLKFNEMKVGIVSSLGTAGAYVDAFFAGVAAGFTDPLNAADAFSKAFETTLVGALAEAEKATASYEKELENARKTVEDSTESVKDNSDEVKDNTDEVKDNTKATEDHTDEEEDNTDAVDDNTDAQDDNKTAAELLQEQLRRNENQVKAVTGAYSDFSDELERSVDLARLDSAEREIQTEIQRGLEAQAKALGKQVKDLTDTEIANVETYVREQVVKRQSAERTADDLQEFDRETQKIIE